MFSIFGGVENYLNMIQNVPIFSQNTCINVGSFSTSFGTKIFCGSLVKTLKMKVRKKVRFMIITSVSGIWNLTSEIIRLSN